MIKTIAIILSCFFTYSKCNEVDSLSKSFDKSFLSVYEYLEKFSHVSLEKKSVGCIFNSGAFLVTIDDDFLKLFSVESEYGPWGVNMQGEFNVAVFQKRIYRSHAQKIDSLITSISMLGEVKRLKHRSYDRNCFSYNDKRIFSIESEVKKSALLMLLDIFILYHKDKLNNLFTYIKDNNLI